MAREIPRPEVFAVGQFRVGDTSVPWAPSQDEIMADAQADSAWWSALGIGAGTRVLFVTLLSEATHVWPLMLSSLLAGAQHSAADATPFDAPRVAMFCHNLDYRVALGIGPATIDGLETLGLDPVEVFADIPIVLARPGAYEHLAAHGRYAHRFLLLGPAVAIGLDPGGPALVDAERWRVETDLDGLVVTSLTDRRLSFHRQVTGIHGTVTSIERDGRTYWAVEPAADS